MPKNLFQDMVKVKRMKQEEGRLSSSPEMSKIPPKLAEAFSLKEENTEPERARKMGNKIGGRRALWVVAVVAVLFFLFSLSFLFVKAEVVVNPKAKSITLNQNLSAVKGAGEELPFDLVVISGQEEKAVAGKELKDVSLAARGTVVIYNAFSSATQRLDIDTRLEGSNGKIYKTEKALTVPGMKGSTPGSVEVIVYGAEAGEGYNSNPLDFKIFGFKGTPKYEKFYGRSKGVLTGGFVGKSPVLSDSEKASLISGLKDSLKLSLLSKAADQIPNGFVLFKDAVVLETSGEVFKLAPDGNNFLASLGGTLYGVLFEEKKLTEKIAEANIAEYDGSGIIIPGIRNLTFSLPQGADISNFANVKSINFNLSGPADLVSMVDEAKLVSDLAGKSKRGFKQILSQYPNIDRAESSISPFWKMSFPDEAGEIKIIVKYPEQI